MPLSAVFLLPPVCRASPFLLQPDKTLQSKNGSNKIFFFFFSSFFSSGSFHPDIYPPYLLFALSVSPFSLTFLSLSPARARAPQYLIQPLSSVNSIIVSPSRSSASLHCLLFTFTVLYSRAIFSPQSLPYLLSLSRARSCHYTRHLRV